MLDAGSLHYSYSVLAAAAVFHIYSRDAALSVSGRFSVNSRFRLYSFYSLQNLDRSLVQTWLVDRQMRMSIWPINNPLQRFQEVLTFGSGLTAINPRKVCQLYKNQKYYHSSGIGGSGGCGSSSSSGASSSSSSFFVNISQSQLFGE